MRLKYRFFPLFAANPKYTPIDRIGQLVPFEHFAIVRDRSGETPMSGRRYVSVLRHTLKATQRISAIGPIRSEIA